jgi:hypothetical protein
MKTIQVPDPRLDYVENNTPLQFLQCDKMGVGRRFFDVVVVKGSYSITDGQLTLASQQAPIALADNYWDVADPERSSLKQAGDVVLGKPLTDVLVTGTARPPGGQALSHWQASAAVRRNGAALLSYAARVTGPRFWRHSAWGWVLSEPEPTTGVPIRYELAYGGAYTDPATADWRIHEPNPSGLGYIDARTVAERYDYPAPQWEALDSPITGINREAALAGFAPIARPWASRLGYAGTYDEAWERQMKADVAAGLTADYPADFDPRFFQCAHPCLIAPCYLAAGDALELAGFFEAADAVSVTLPAGTVVADLHNGAGDVFQHALVLDTVHVDVDSALVHLTWRLTLDQAHDIRGAELHQKDMS